MAEGIETRIEVYGLKEALKEAGCKHISKRKEALKMYGKYIEQQVFIKRLLSKIIFLVLYVFF
jgi:hypothetical protein